MRCVAALLLVAGRCHVATADDPPQRLLGGDRAQLPVFDHSVLGNLRGADKVAPLRVTRDHMMVAKILIGTPPQTLRCLLDTSHADLWVPSKRCTSCTNVRHFRADRSSTFAPELTHTSKGLQPLPVHISYGNGDIMGFLARDTVSLGSITAENQSFIIVEGAAMSPHRSWDGICGLGWRQGAKSAKARGTLYKHIQEKEGQATFAIMPTPGGGAKLLVNGALDNILGITWVNAEPVTPGGDFLYWVVSGGLAVHRQTPVRSRFLVDMGTPFLLAPPRFYISMVRSLIPEGQFDEYCGVDTAAGNQIVCHCSVLQTNEMLPLRVYFEGQQFVLPPEKLFRTVESTREDDDVLCLLLVQQNPMTSLDPMEILSGLVAGSITPTNSLPAGVPIATLGNVTSMPSQGVLPRMSGSGISAPTPPFSIRPPLPSASDERRLQEVPLLGTLVGNPMDDLWVLGGVFLDEFVSVLDFDNKRVGFAQPPWRDAADTVVEAPASVDPALDGPPMPAPAFGGTIGLLPTHAQVQANWMRHAHKHRIKASEWVTFIALWCCLMVGMVSIVVCCSFRGGGAPSAREPLVLSDVGRLRSYDDGEDPEEIAAITAE